MVRQVRAVSIVDAIAEDLRTRLFTGQLKKNAQLTEASVSTMYEIARPTAKAAIEKLVGEGLLVRGPHKTARVPALGADDIRDIYWSREYLESVAIRRLAGKSEVPESVYLAEREVVRARDAGVPIIEPDMRFHLSLVESLQSPRITKAYESLIVEVRLCWSQIEGQQLFSSDLMCQEHEKLLEFISAGDTDAALVALADHLGRSRERLAAVLTQDA